MAWHKVHKEGKKKAGIKLSNTDVDTNSLTLKAPYGTIHYLLIHAEAVRLCISTLASVAKAQVSRSHICRLRLKFQLLLFMESNMSLIRADLSLICYICSQG